MLIKEINQIKEPFLIKFLVEDKFRTLIVNPFTYDPKMKSIMMLDLETKESFKGVVVNNKIEKISKVEMFLVKSYEEFINNSYSIKR